MIIVKGRRCSQQGISSEAASLRVDIERWQEETGNAGLPTTDQHQKLRLRIDKYLSADRQQKRKKALETRYPLVYLQTDPAADTPRGTLSSKPFFASVACLHSNT